MSLSLRRHVIDPSTLMVGKSGKVHLIIVVGIVCDCLDRRCGQQCTPVNL